ncbi:hypothetical protein N1031_09885 [Herbiconiux moechotypicola]|uniref:Uncharacterized protein n=1 Tax=Herbiconiux moechotypicola TaxID=637393 RepID=A0ABP5QGI4_9MICO|nr:hypothetical protein [Herbiconiux moechotypicola]MCS5730070.1 hypothetical protein [Herbiconiux moechotypicola]
MSTTAPAPTSAPTPDPALTGHPLSREARLVSSQRKIRLPFRLDDSMRFYSPQENVDSLAHPRVAAWLDFIENTWAPDAAAGPAGAPRIALLVPCCKMKPYLVSREHRAINQALLDAGWVSTGTVPVPEGLAEAVDREADPALFDASPLVRDGVVLDRFVVSEPLGMVPYENVYHWNGEQSPATSYDDPGLFEARGTSVSPEHPLFTATPVAGGKYSWGPGERQAYVAMHNRMAEVIAASLVRLAPYYASTAAWLSPGLTHRSFLAGTARRAEDGLAYSRRGVDGVELPLVGVGDLVPAEVGESITMMPTQTQIAAAKEALTARLAATGRAATPGAMRAVFARGDGHDTPLGLPEALVHLTAWLDEAAAAAGASGGES